MPVADSGKKTPSATPRANCTTNSTPAYVKALLQCMPLIPLVAKSIVPNCEVALACSR
ncbi:hypothetical protein XTGART2_3133 [Xanthomonas translucens pv. graminis]|uniref:Uncharacterized protein n=2 Tax=Xanthomonas graminis TaxID=3390026 RepID=A0A0K3A5A7_9XANT|nr:hypothetical protein XTG29_01303 [Xanthomonas translucens pv. graminis ART-Xtg29]CTP90720.1 hypothetical protein XTALMG727_3168 [Xanthomonas translucens pv. arrhenatheri LMG 727]SBV44132.1 hypothetical protein XTGART2_3133 [Xanthomonas translucens pv. graminis]SBV45008.1 hypothetical protein XTGART9_3130 [Xanthomonas translucens pv. graminis]SBV48150.1 hypothetical protein XTGART29_2809 [Xanthomonas translucens pv. graminis ART-Xtg29]